MAKIYRSLEELGRAVIAARPDLEGRNPEEVGRQVEPQLTGGDRVVDEFGDIDIGNTVGNFPSDFTDTAGESFEGMKEVVGSPIEKGVKPFASLALGGVSELGREFEKPGLLNTLLSNPNMPVAPLITMLGKGLDKIDTSASPFGGQQTRPLVTDEDRTLARTAAADFKESFHPANLEQRPANALANATSVLPVGPGHIQRFGLLNKLGRTGRAASKVASVASPDLAVEQAITLLPQLVKGAAKRTPAALRKVAGNEKVQAALRPVKEFGDNLKVGGRSLKGEAVQSGLGITTGRSREFIHQIFERAKSPQFREFFRTARRMSESDLTQRLQAQAFKGMEKLQQKASDMYEKGTLQFFGNKGRNALRLPGEGLHDSIINSLDKVDVKINPRTGRLTFGKSAITALGPARGVLQQELRPILRLLKVKQGTPAHMIHRRRQLLDDAISTLSPDSQISDTARGVLTEIRKGVADYLEKGLGDEYVTAMRDYRTLANLRTELNNNLRLAPGQLDKHGNIAGNTQEQALRAMEGAIMQSGTGSNRLKALEQLEQVSGVKGIVDLQLARLAQNIAGGGLIVRNEIAQIGRLVFGAAFTGGTGGISGGLLALPAATLFSPRFVSEYLLIAQGGVRESVARMSAATKASLQRKAKRVSRAMAAMDKATGGELRQRALRENWNVSQMLERFEIQEEDGE